MNRAHVEITPDAGGEWRWRLKAANGEIVCQGESHPDEAGARRAFLRTAELMAEVTGLLVPTVLEDSILERTTATIEGMRRVVVKAPSNIAEHVGHNVSITELDDEPVRVHCEDCGVTWETAMNPQVHVQ